MAVHKAPTIEETTPKNSHKVIFKEWITGRDTEYVNGAFYKGLQAKPSIDGTVQFGNIDTNNIGEATHRSIKSWVVSVDGVEGADAVLEAVLDMHISDYTFVVKKIDELSKKK